MFAVIRSVGLSKGRAIACCCLVSFCSVSISSGHRVYMEITLQEESAEISPKILDVLSDFQFIGSAMKGASVDSHVSIRSQDVPRGFEAGTQYMWLKKGYADNQHIFKTLQVRLRARGINILSAKGLSNRFIGGLAFSISFKDGLYTGTFFNRLDPRIVKNKKLQRHWGFDDYILVFEKTP
jgi:hypothetical protein